MTCQPFVVAHRSGNSLEGLAAAERDGATVVEADIHAFWGRLEVRHLKTIGPIPILWDRWFLANPFQRRLLLPELMRAATPTTRLMLDLKGAFSGIGAAVRRVLVEQSDGREIIVCSRNWRALGRLGHVDGVRIAYSVGSPRQLTRLLRRPEHDRLDMVVVKRDLLSPAVATRLRALAGTVMSWPVDTVEQMDALIGMGVEGLITHRPEVLQRALAKRTSPAGRPGP